MPYRRPCLSAYLWCTLQLTQSGSLTLWLCNSRSASHLFSDSVNCSASFNLLREVNCAQFAAGSQAFLNQLPGQSDGISFEDFMKFGLGLVNFILSHSCAF